MDKHLSESEAWHLLALDEHSIEDIFPVLSHVFTCGRCRGFLEALDSARYAALARRLFPEGDFPVLDDSESYARLRARINTSFREHLKALRRFENGRLREMSPEQVELLARNLEGRKLTAFLVSLDRECRSLFSENPKAARDLASIGHRSLRNGHLEAGTDRAYFEAIFLAHWGNAQRVIGHLRKALWSLRQAIRLCEDTSDDMARGLAFRYLALTLADLRSYKAALAASEKAEEVYASLDDVEERRNQLFLRAKIKADEGRFEESTGILESLIDQATGPLGFASRYQLVINYLGQGQQFQAAAMLKTLKKAHPTGVLLIRLRWLEALVLAATGQDEVGHDLMEGVHSYFLGEGLAIDVALAATDLLRFRLRLRRSAKGLFRHVWPLLLENHTQAAKALGRLRDELLQGTLTEDLVSAVRRFIQDCARDPSYTVEDAGL